MNDEQSAALIQILRKGIVENKNFFMCDLTALKTAASELEEWWSEQ